jgi:arabinose-5-phosphate isomerase
MVCRASVQAIKVIPSERRAFLKATELISNRLGNIVVSGVGKSGHVGNKIAATLTSLGHRAISIDPLHALHGDSGIVTPGDVFIAISFSGVSKELVQLARHLKAEFDIKIVAITGESKSPLGKVADVIMPVLVRSEGSPMNLAPMASTVTTMVIGDMLAAALTDPKLFQKKHFAQLHPGGALGMKMKTVEEIMIKKIPVVTDDQNLKSTLEIIGRYGKGVVAVTKNSSGRLIGVITDGDVRRYVSKHSDTSGAKAKDVMSVSPKSIKKTVDLHSALLTMEANKITSLFVLDKGKPVGLIHVHDILEINLQNK